MAVPFLHVRAGGTNREIGRQVGEAARAQIEAAIAYYREDFERLAGMTFACAESEAAAYLEQARRHMPHLAEELEGMAEGAGLSLLELAVPNCGEEFTAAGDHCTAVAVSAGGRHVVGHNMDWYSVDMDKNVLFDLTLPGGTRVLTIAGVPYLPMLGMTSDGIGNVSNSVSSNDNRVGVPNAFVRRWCVEAGSLEEACGRGRLAGRARGTNHFLADLSGRLWDMETSATSDALADHSGAGWMVHTNHYVVPAMAPFEGSDAEESRTRLSRASALVQEGLARGDDPVDLVMRVLRDHEPRRDEAVCGHAPPDNPDPDYGVTVASMVCDLDARRLYACAGPPCENPYQVFEMD